MTTFRRVLSKLLLCAAGVLGLIWFRWTPQSGKGVILFAALTLALLLIVIVVGNVNDAKDQGWGFKPWDSERTARKGQNDSDHN
jgi:hypothetical protein